MKCLDLYLWYPSRKHAKNREPTQPVIGITNYDRCSKTYWLIGEIDNHSFKINQLVKEETYMIVKTRKGYHLYFKYHNSNPLKVIHYGLKYYKFLDKHHLRMGLWRYRNANDKRKAFLVLRVSPKYSYPDMEIVYFDKESTEWHRQVRDLILFFSS
ncbi:MAG: hypothetical protein DRO40_08605 [Thermoprotei archaeon]|nr:MAG: hypothetical protein DRO40_08605 [Thermoprotei archaeon]